MARKLSKSRKRVHHRSHRSQPSAVAALFTFPKLAIYGFIILLVMFVYQISIPTHDVKGVSTTADYQIYTQAQFKAMAKNPSADDKKKYWVSVGIFADKDGDSNYDSNEGCLYKDFTFTINGVRKTRSVTGICELAVIKSSNKCNTLDLVSTFSNYKVTGVYYMDGTHQHGQPVKGKTKVTVCGGQHFYQITYNATNWALKAK